MNWVKPVCLLAILFGFIQQTHASVVLGGTRVIFDATKKEVSTRVYNNDDKAVFLVQSWVEDKHGQKGDKVPFMVTPPLFRLAGGQENMLRIVHTSNTLPQDKESLYWLSVKAIPSTVKTDENRINISIKTRIKLIYRPTNLAGNAADAYKEIKFSRVGNELQANNPTPYYISMQRVSVGGQEIKEAMMLEPGETQRWKIPQGVPAQVEWNSINDFGGVMPNRKINL
ncbi:molecular chaperone [Pantoea sp. Taur]|uniref:fimbrial biogenesis chaperone n=1 Tax=Pantoea sp. Taur TaxID=2576757 RepID=UPI0013529232|nr:molecular chaperone [Pantoea sp. Taur]MXP58524.1 molecular chaperone [Pantoea sp. Taur]